MTSTCMARPPGREVGMQNLEWEKGRPALPIPIPTCPTPLQIKIKIQIQTQLEIQNKYRQKYKSLTCSSIHLSQPIHWHISTSQSSLLQTHIRKNDSLQRLVIHTFHFCKFIFAKTILFKILVIYSYHFCKLIFANNRFPSKDWSPIGKQDWSYNQRIF